MTLAKEGLIPRKGKGVEMDFCRGCGKEIDEDDVFQCGKCGALVCESCCYGSGGCAVCERERGKE